MPESSAAELNAALHDDKYRRRVAEALDRAYQRAAEADGGHPRPLDVGTARYVIFSDQHKGMRDGADDFRCCERAYNAALAYYFAAGHTLVELGDVEELWEGRPGPVVATYKYSLELSARFHNAGRYLRFYGNHDDAWAFPDQVARHLHPIFGDALTVHEGMRFRIVDGDRELGFLFMVHGHHGTRTSDRFGRLARIPVRLFWRPIQRVFGASLNTPATHWVLRERHNVAMYAWASSRRVALIAGHTHRPVFTSETLAAALERKLHAAVEALAEAPADPTRRDAVAELSAELEWARVQDREETGPEGRGAPVVPMAIPCYFNTGCCCFIDGDITGIEIADGEIRLVRWPDDDERPKPRILARMRLEQALASSAPAVGGWVRP